jgi:predicted transcriptional regulator
MNIIKFKGLIIDYSLSFTAASLMYFETEQIANLYLEHEDWIVVQQLVVDENILQKGTVSTRKREFSEIKKRLKNLSNDELKFIVTCTTDELKLFCLYLCARTYRLIYEFIVEVIREKYLMFDYLILDSDYIRFIESKMAASMKLQKITQKTQYKIRQVIFRILEQAVLIDSAKTKNIQKPYVPQELESIIAQSSVKYLVVFLYSDTDIKNIKESMNV